MAFQGLTCRQDDSNSDNSSPLPVRWRHWRRQARSTGEVPVSARSRRLGRRQSEEDRKENEFSLVHGFRLLSSYKLRNGTKLWIITEADRSSTTLLLPDEY